MFGVQQDRIRVGIAGLGGIGSTHARALAGLRDEGLPVSVPVFSGGSPERSAECGWSTARQIATDELIHSADVDVVAVCTPSATHPELALTALSAGHHVVVEKPMALTVEDAEAIVDRAKSRDLLVSPIAQRRFEPEHLYLKSLLEQGRLGRVVLGETFVHWYRDHAYYQASPWRRDPAGGSGSLMNQGLHNADLLCWLLGGAADVTGHTATLGHDDLPVEDTCVATVRFRSGALGVIATTTATPPGMPAEVAIWTTTGFARLDQGSGVRHWDFADIAPPPESSSAGSGASDPAAIGITGHTAQWRDVLSALWEGRSPAVDATDGLATTAVLAGIYTAATEGRTLNVAAPADTGTGSKVGPKTEAAADADPTGLSR